MNISTPQRYLLSILSGFLMTLAFPYTGSIFPLFFIAWIPLLLVEHFLYNENAKSRHIFIHAFVTFIVFNSGANYWLYYSQNAGIVPMAAHLVNALLMTLPFMAYHWTKRSLGTKLGLLSFPVFWIAFEYLHYNWELSTPWLTHGNIFSIAPQVIQWYSYVGVLGGSLWIIIVNLLLFKAITNILFEKKPFKKQTLLVGGALLVFLTPMALSWWSYSTYKEIQRPIEVIITQPNVEQYKERKEMGIKDQLDRMLDVAIPLITDSTLIVLGPETVVPNHFPINEQYYYNDTAFNYLQRHVNQWNGVSIYMGVASYKVFKKQLRHSMRKYTNHNLYYEQYDASVLIRKETAPLFVHKSKLLLMAEKIPFSKWFPVLEDYAMDLRGTAGTLGSGTKPEVLRTNGFSFAPVNCYETIYGEWVGEQTAKGAEVLFALTNDGWWGESAGYKQHNSFSRLRAIESRRYVARASMTGVSSVINQRGDVIQSIPFGVHDAMRATLHLNKKQTFYAQNGDLIGKLLLNIAYILMVVNVFIYGRKKLRKVSSKGK